MMSRVNYDNYTGGVNVLATAEHYRCDVLIKPRTIYLANDGYLTPKITSLFR